MIKPSGSGWLSQETCPDWLTGASVFGVFEDDPDWQAWAAALPDDIEPWMWVEDRESVQLYHRRGREGITISIALPATDFTGDLSTAEICHAAIDRLYRHVASR